MNRFLKREWDNTEIPESLLLRVRDRAWNQAHSRPRTAGGPWIWAAAGAAVLVVIVFYQRPTMLTALEPSLPIAARSFKPLAPAEPEVAVSSAPRSTPRPVRSAAVARIRDQIRKDAPAQVEQILPEFQQTRLVSTFRLAGTGVRMIWVQDANFFKETGDSP